MLAHLTLDLRTVTSPDIVADRILDACQLARIIYVRSHPRLGCQRAFWDAVIARHGLRIPVDEDAATGIPTGALWSDVEFDPAKPGTFRHSNAAQPLHTDGSYINDPPEFVFLICHRAARSGGATVFVDGLDLFEMLSKESPALLSELMRTPLRFKKGGGVVEAPFLVREGRGLLMRWNYYALDKEMAPDQHELAQRLQAFLLQLTAQRRTREVLLQPADAVFFRDASVLHGRNAFRAEQRGDRCLWKGGLAGEPILSMSKQT